MKRGMPTGKRIYSKEFLLDKLREAAILRGESPSGRWLEEHLPGFPSKHTFARYFGSMKNALALIDLPPCPIGGNRHPGVPIGPRDGIAYRNPRNRGRSVNEKINLRLRFKILERDKFTCQYCGRTPQDGVKLAVDHINPVKNGGTLDSENLVTSCFECNIGKFDLVLSITPKTKTPPETTA